MIKHLLQYSFVAAVVLAAAFNSFGTEAIFSKNSPLSFLNAIIANEVTLSADSVAGMPSIEVVVPVRVKGFSNMITGQGTLSFDPAVVSFVGIEQYGLPGMGASNFGTTQATKGKVFFSWDDATLAGRTLADNAVVFAVRFKVIGKYGESSNVSFVNTPVPLEFVDKDFASADLALVAGKVQVPAYSITTSALNSNNLCVGSTVSVSFTKEGNYDAANTFTAQLSDASGSFTTPTVIGTGKDSPITATIPASATAGTGYRIRVISSSPAITGSNNGSDITIVSLSEASSVSIVSSSAANKSIYDGVYEVNGSFVDSFNSSFLGKYPKVIELRTIDENSVYYFDQEYELDGHIFQASTGLTYYGNWQAIFNFGTTHTIESVINNYGQPSGNSRRSGRIDSKGINKATFESNGLPKTIEVSYIMLQNDVDRSFFTETYSYKGPTSCAATYTLQAAGAPVGGTYRWYKSSIGGEAIYESAEPNYVTSPIYSSNSPQYFYVSIVNSNGCEGPRKSIEVVYAPDVVKPTATAAERCGTGTLTLTASGAPAGSSYSWYTSATGGTPISGVSTASFTTPALTATTTYYVATKNSTGCESERVAVVATIVPDIVANTVSADQTICSGSRPVELKGSLPTGGNGTYAYQWEQSTDGTTFSTITGATSQHYTPETLTATTWYRRKVAAGTTCSESISSAVKVTVSPLPASPVVTNANICSGASTTLNVSTPVAGYSYKWYSAATGGTALTAGSSYTTPVLTATTIYYVESVSAAGCVSSRTAVTVTINPIPTKPTVTAAARCGEGSVTLEAAGAPTGANYRWYTTATGGTPILGATTAFYATPNLSAPLF